MSTILQAMAAGSAYMGRFNRCQLFFVPETQHLLRDLSSRGKNPRPAPPTLITSITL